MLDNVLGGARLAVDDDVDEAGGGAPPKVLADDGECTGMGWVVCCKRPLSPLPCSCSDSDSASPSSGWSCEA